MDRRVPLLHNIFDPFFYVLSLETRLSCWNLLCGHRYGHTPSRRVLDHGLLSNAGIRIRMEQNHAANGRPSPGFLFSSFRSIWIGGWRRIGGVVRFCKGRYARPILESRHPIYRHDIRSGNYFLYATNDSSYPSSDGITGVLDSEHAVDFLFDVRCLYPCFAIGIGRSAVEGDYPAAFPYRS